MIKQNHYIKKIKELLQNSRTRAATKLVLWFFFFLFVFVAFDIRGNHSTNNQTAYNTLDKWKNSNNYEFQVLFTINNEQYLLHGIRNGNSEKFYFNDKTYLLENNHLYILENDNKILEESFILLDFNFLKLRPEFLGQITSYGKLEYTTNFESGMIKKGYSINTAKFVELYDNLMITDDSMITMELVEQEDVITEVNLDLKNYQKYNQKLIEEYKIQIVYSKIGMISNIDLE